MLKPYILFRNDPDTEEEFRIAREVWGSQCVRFRSDIPEGSLVIGRYSVLPFFKELEEELRTRGSRLINTGEVHNYIAQMHWYQDLKDLTPRTWIQAGWATVPETPYGYVVKGRTNSRKFKWDTHMRAPSKNALRGVLERLYDDPLIADQGVVIREYIPLRQIEEGINGLPVTNEWRLFFYGETLLSAGYYWAQAEDAVAMNAAGLAEAGMEVAREAASIITRKWEGRGHRPFVVIDVGETEEGEWIVIEVNSGQMSGLSMVDPRELYTNMKKAL